MPSAIGLRHPASASCLRRHSRLAGRCPNNSSLFPPLAAVVVVALWAYSAENLFLFRNSGKSADFPELPFHGKGSQRGTAALHFSSLNPLRLTTFASSPEGGALSALTDRCVKAPPFGGAGTPSGVTERVIHSSCSSNPLTVSTVTAVKPAALMAAAASSKPKVSAAVSWASAVMSTLPPSLFHSPSSHAPG